MSIGLQFVLRETLVKRQLLLHELYKKCKGPIIIVLPRVLLVDVSCIK